EPIELIVAPDDRTEAERVVRRARELGRSGAGAAGRREARLDDVAILYRTNSQSRLFEETLHRHQVPYVMIGGTRFYDRKEVRDVVAYARVVLNPKDEASLRRIVNLPPRDIGKTTIEAVQEVGRREGLGFVDAVTRAIETKAVTARAARALQGFLDLVGELRRESLDLPPSRLIARIVSRTGFDAHLRATQPGDAATRIENLAELVNAVATYDGMEDGLQAFLDRTALLGETDNVHGSSGVRLMTLHAAKGLEFPVIFIVGVEEDLTPHLRAAEEDGGLEEERRLFYVGMTRAKERLVLTRALTRFQFGQSRVTEPSRFLLEIPARLLREAVAPDDGRDFAGRIERAAARIGARRQGDPERDIRHWAEVDDLPDESTPPSLYTLGCKVHHSEYGVGTVIGIEGIGEGQKVTVSFSIYGAKKFLPRYARLERI
ncbi:MAG TPA: 3'-5' exonuclease, partial [Dongiaceae bacterium]|nr:3'-5' exonuclease [Dongiaceae bacterium]